MERIKNFFSDESGAAAVEYGLLVGLIAVAIVVAVGLRWPSVNGHVCRTMLRQPCPNLFGPGGMGKFPASAAPKMAKTGREI